LFETKKNGVAQAIIDDQPVVILIDKMSYFSSTNTQPEYYILRCYQLNLDSMLPATGMTS